MADSRIDELRRRLEREPGSRLFAQLAEEHRKAGELPEAIRVARAGLTKHPVYPSARLTLGRALLDSGDAAGAKQELEEALRQAPDNILASRFLGQALEQLGELERALGQYAATLKMAPGDQQLAAHIRDLTVRSAASGGGLPQPTGPMPRVPPPPLPVAAAASHTAKAVQHVEGPPPVLRESPTPAPGAAGSPASEIGGTTLPARPAPPALREPLAPQIAAPGPEPPVPVAPHRSEAPTVQVSAEDGGGTIRSVAGGQEEPQPSKPAEEGEAAAPFSSSTLAELYLRQGLEERAREVYRQVLVQDPGNERARARLMALETEKPATDAKSPQDQDPAARRHALERTIAGLEALLAGVRRR